MSDRTVELRFHLLGQTIPVDHGYQLYGALSRQLPWLHETDEIAVAPIQGLYSGNGNLTLRKNSVLNVRTPVERLPSLLALSGKRLVVGGNTIRVGVPSTFALVPAASLYAHLVTTKHGEDEARFDTEIRRQLNKLGIQGRFVRGTRRTVSVHGKQIVGYSVLVDELTAEESIRLQEKGLGGRRKMGCGVFVPRR